jgi:hypothetical protein
MGGHQTGSHMKQQPIGNLPAVSTSTARPWPSENSVIETLGARFCLVVTIQIGFVHFLYFPCVGITQLVVGPASASKTQLALTLCADYVIRNQKAVCILVGSNGSHKMGCILHRLQTMRAARSAWSNVSPQTIHEWMSMVYLLCFWNAEDLMDLLHYQLPRLLQLHPMISLVVLDGIANFQSFSNSRQI